MRGGKRESGEKINVKKKKKKIGERNFKLRARSPTYPIQLIDLSLLARSNVWD